MILAHQTHHESAPAAVGRSLILNVLGVLIIFPLLNLADTLILTSLPLPGFKMYFPKPVLVNLLVPATDGLISILTNTWNRYRNWVV